MCQWAWWGIGCVAAVVITAYASSAKEGNPVVGILAVLRWRCVACGGLCAWLRTAARLAREMISTNRGGVYCRVAVRGRRMGLDHGQTDLGYRNKKGKSQGKE